MGAGEAGVPLPSFACLTMAFLAITSFLQAHSSRLVIPPKLPYDGALVAPFLPILV